MEMDRPVESINDVFLKSNRAARRRLLQEMPAILLVNNDILSLYNKEKLVQERKLELETYHVIKSVVHFITGKNCWAFRYLPPSPRQGHTAMQYFSRLTGKEDQFAFVPTNDEAATKAERKLFYVENVYDPRQTLDIVAQLILERNVFDHVVDMNTDILAYDSKEYLKRVCGK